MYEQVPTELAYIAVFANIHVRMVGTDSKSSCFSRNFLPCKKNSEFTLFMKTLSSCKNL